MVDSWYLPVIGSPRSVAAHPTQLMLAVAVKRGGFGTESTVVLIDVKER
jgi:hypothetical protein